jgi:hypothetical protein
MFPVRRPGVHLDHLKISTSLGGANISMNVGCGVDARETSWRRKEIDKWALYGNCKKSKAMDMTGDGKHGRKQ